MILEPLNQDGTIKNKSRKLDQKEQPRKYAGNLKTSGYREAELEDEDKNEGEYFCEGSIPKCINGLITYAYRPEPYDNPQDRFAKYKPVFCSDCQKGRQLKDQWDIERVNKRQNYLLKQSNLPLTGIFENLTLDSFALTGNGKTGWFQEVKNWVENWIPGCFKGLILYGRYGVGKTGLLTAVLKELINRHYTPVFYMTVDEFSERIGEAWVDRRGEDHYLIRLMCEAEVLFLDEIGSGNSKFRVIQGNTPLGNLSKVIDFRYRHGKPILLATNCEIPSELLEVLGERTFNRVFETSQELFCEGKNLRQ